MGKRRGVPVDAGVIDLSGFDAFVAAQEEGRECVIVHPVTGKPLTMRVVVRGPDSRAFKDAVRAMSKARVERAIEGKAADPDADGIRFVASLCVSWSGFLVDGKELAFSAEAAAEVFRRFPFIYDQVEAFQGRRANFTSG